MGEMADMDLERMERGESLVRNNKTKEEFAVSNIELIHLNTYSEPEYTILGAIDD